MDGTIFLYIFIYRSKIKLIMGLMISILKLKIITMNESDLFYYSDKCNIYIFNLHTFKYFLCYKFKGKHICMYLYIYNSFNLHPNWAYQSL